MAISKWAYGPFDLLVHGEQHLRAGDDFDRRIALISLDNSIEVSIVNYLTMNPAFRGGKSYDKAKKVAWLETYPSKLQFLEFELAQRKLPWHVSEKEILWVHEQRNEQYHGKDGGVPSRSVLSTARDAAIWVFGLLFNVQNVTDELEEALRTNQPKPTRITVIPRDARFDSSIDDEFGVIEFGDQAYFASDILFHVDPDAYRAIGLAYLGEDQDQ